ncbi:hypothetical protein D3C78_1241290 [compost metagenome]
MAQSLSGDIGRQHALPRGYDRIAVIGVEHVQPLLVIEIAGRRVRKTERLEQWVAANAGAILADPPKQTVAVQHRGRHQTVAGDADFARPHGGP